MINSVVLSELALDWISQGWSELGVWEIGQRTFCIGKGACKHWMEPAGFM